jgi:CDP-diacylglycerol--serine O-phosphatidyltransferase
MNMRSQFLTLLTLSVLFLGVKSIISAGEGHIVAAALFIVAASVLDAIDGTLARKLRASSEFGARLDGYVDAISFGVAPAVLLYAALGQHNSMLGSLLAGLVASFGVLRFARGCDLENAEGRHAFRGMPIPVTGLWIAMYALMAEGAIPGINNEALGTKILGFFMVGMTVVLLLLQVSNVPYEKMRGKFCFVGLGITAVLMYVTGFPLLTLWCAMCVTTLIYMVVSPIRARQIEFTDEEQHEAPVSLSH